MTCTTTTTIMTTTTSTFTSVQVTNTVQTTSPNILHSAMDSLPQDLIDEIVSYLLPNKPKPKRLYQSRKKRYGPSQHGRLAPLATVSRRLQTAVERLTFRYIKITSEETSRFAELLTPARRYSLAGLIFTAILPEYDYAAAQRAESPEERTANDEAYTRAIHALFHVLKTWEVENPETIPYRLELSINHPMSHDDRPWPSKYAPWGQVVFCGHACIHEGRFLHSYIDLQNPEALPVLQRVTGLIMRGPDGRYGHRNVYPKVPILLASRMPKLDALYIAMDDDEKRFPEIRRRNREEVAHALRALSLPELRKAEFHFFIRRFGNEAVSPPILHDLSIPDPLSSALHDFSQNLVNLEFHGAFDLSILRPLRGLSETAWPRLRYFDLELHPTTPSGGWYFDGGSKKPTSAPYIPRVRDPWVCHSKLHEEHFSYQAEGEYAFMIPEDTFRCKVSDETFVPVIDAFADALSVMPKLTSAALNCYLEDNSMDPAEPMGWFSIAYFGPCKNAPKHQPQLLCPKCRLGPTRELTTLYMGWEPSEQLAAKLRGIQEAFRSEPMVIKTLSQFLDDRGEVEGPEDYDFDDDDYMY